MDEGRVALVNNARIYTLDSGNTVIESGSMAFTADDEILGLGDAEAMAKSFSGAIRTDMGGKTILPGLIDSRFHGVFAPNFKHRNRIVPCQPRGTVDSDKPTAPINWMQRLKRVFAIDSKG